MLSEKDVLATFADLRVETLYVWIERGWIAPGRGREGYRFREIDVARLKLIREFSTELDLGDDAMDVVLPLLDQIHGLRHQLHRLADAVNAQPEDVRHAVAALLAKDDD